MKKLLSVSAILMVAVVLLTGCFGSESTTVIVFDHSGIEGISGTMRLTIEARGDRVRTWEEITHYNLAEYKAFYGYADADAIRDWFAGPGPGLITRNGMSFELIDITDTQVITRMFYDYTVISSADREWILGAPSAFISLAGSIEMNEAMGGRVIQD